jgi:hypothetical protein
MFLRPIFTCLRSFFFTFRCESGVDIAWRAKHGTELYKECVYVKGTARENERNRSRNSARAQINGQTRRRRSSRDDTDADAGTLYIFRGSRARVLVPCLIARVLCTTPAGFVHAMLWQGVLIQCRCFACCAWVTVRKFIQGP